MSSKSDSMIKDLKHFVSMCSKCLFMHKWQLNHHLKSGVLVCTYLAEMVPVEGRGGLGSQFEEMELCCEDLLGCGHSGQIEPVLHLLTAHCNGYDTVRRPYLYFHGQRTLFGNSRHTDQLCIINKKTGLTGLIRKQE